MITQNRYTEWTGWQCPPEKIESMIAIVKEKLDMNDESHELNNERLAKNIVTVCVARMRIDAISR